MISNACCIYESNGFRLLADPWLTDGAFEGSWFHDPPLKAKPEDFLDVDALYISHIHPDHADPETLKHFRRDIPIVTLADQNSFCAKHLSRMGFTDVFAMQDGTRTEIGPFDVKMFGPFTRHPFHGDDCEVGNIVDSAIWISDGRCSVLNTNDNTPSIAAARALQGKYGSPTVAQLQFNSAGPYPACFINLSREEKLAEHHRLIERQLEHSAMVGAVLGAQLVQPFAGAYRLGMGYEHMNEYLGTTSAEYAAEFFRGRGLRASALVEGATLDVAALARGEGESLASAGAV